MIDANSQFFAILTNVGMAKQANADALGIPWKFTHMGVGDANNTDPIPNATQTRLINEWRRRPLNQVRVDPVNPAVIIAEQIIPADEGGFWIREIGLYDADGDLVAVANCAPSFKPVLSQGSGRTQVVRMNFIVASTGNITLKIDPAVVLATREYVDSRIQEELYKLDSKQSVRVATTANIALAGLQTLDGIALVAGDRVLVKNQTVAKDNGLYVAAATVWSRAPDADSNAEVTSALLTSVEQGATQADTRWQLVTDGLIVLGTTALTFQNVTQGFAPINSPALISPTATSTPVQFDTSKLLATTEFVQRALGSYSGGRAVATGVVTLVAADIGQFITLSLGSAQTATLPLLSDVPVGATIALHNPSAVDKTIATAGTDKISPEGAQYGFITLRWGETAYLTKESGVWRLHGSPALRYSKSLSGADWTTQPQFANDKSFATTEFVRRTGKQYSGFSSYNGNGAIPAASVGQLFVLFGNAANTINLPSTVGLPLGSTVTIDCFNAGSAAITCNGTDVIYGAAAGTVPSMTMLYGDTLELTVIGNTAGNGQWYVTGGNMVLSNAIPQFDSGRRPASTEFVQRSLGNMSGYSSVSGSVAIPAASAGKYIIVNSPGTITLPDPSTLPLGAVFTIEPVGSTGIVTCTGATSGSFSGPNVGAPAASVAVLDANVCKFVAVGTQYRVFGGSGKAQLAASGFQKSPSGMIDQWGVIPSIPANSSVLLTFPIAFPNAFLGVSGVGGATAAGVPGVNYQAVSNTQIRFWNQSTTAATQSGAYRVHGY